MALTLVQDNSVITPSSTNTTDTTVVLDAPATAGNILWYCIGFDKNAGTITPPSGFTGVISYTSSSVSHWMGYKVAVGGEDTFTCSRGTSGPNGNTAWCGEFSSSLSGDWTILGSSSANTGASSTTSLSTGTTGAIADPGGALASFATDSGQNVGTTAYTNSFTELLDDTGVQGQASCCVAWKDGFAASSTAETTFSYTGGSADQHSAGIVVFEKVASNVDATVNATTVAATASVPAVTASGGATVNPSVISAIASVLAPTITTESNATVSPTTVQAIADILAPEIFAQAGATVEPDTVAAIATVESPAVLAGGDTTVTPVTVEAIASVPEPSVSGEQNATITASTVLAITNIAAPDVQTEVVVSPPVVEAFATVPGVTIIFTTDAIIAVSPVEAVAAILSPEILSDIIERWNKLDETPTNTAWTRVE